jgi:hypothetical protein
MNQPFRILLSIAHVDVLHKHRSARSMAIRHRSMEVETIA